MKLFKFKKSQKGFTLPELLIAAFFLFWLVVVVAIIFIAIHFIGKFW